MDSSPSSLSSTHPPTHPSSYTTRRIWTMRSPSLRFNSSPSPSSPSSPPFSRRVWPCSPLGTGSKYPSPAARPTQRLVGGWMGGWIHLLAFSHLPTHPPTYLSTGNFTQACALNLQNGGASSSSHFYTQGNARDETHGWYYTNPVRVDPTTDECRLSGSIMGLTTAPQVGPPPPPPPPLSLSLCLLACLLCVLSFHSFMYPSTHPPTHPPTHTGGRPLHLPGLYPLGSLGTLLQTQGAEIHEDR